MYLKIQLYRKNFIEFSQARIREIVASGRNQVTPEEIKGLGKDVRVDHGFYVKNAVGAAVEVGPIADGIHLPMWLTLTSDIGVLEMMHLLDLPAGEIIALNSDAALPTEVAAITARNAALSVLNDHLWPLGALTLCYMTDSYIMDFMFGNSLTDCLAKKLIHNLSQNPMLREFREANLPDLEVIIQQPRSPNVQSV